MKRGQFSYCFSICVCVVLFLMPISGRPVFASSSVGKTLMVRKLLFSTQLGADRKPMFVVRAEIEASGNGDQSIELEATIRREDNGPIRLSTSAPRFYSEQNGTVVYKWSSPTTSGTDLNNLFAIFPNHMLSVGQFPCVVVVRFKVTLGGLTAYLDGRTTYPMPSRLQGIQMGGVSTKQTIRKHTSPNPAAMKVDQPNIETNQEMVNCGLDFSVYGAQGQSVYVGAVFRYPDGSPVSPSGACPSANIGKGGQVQVQRSTSVQRDFQTWSGIALQVPVAWLETDRSTEQILVAGMYGSANGLWGYAEIRWTLPPADVTEEEGSDRAISARRTLSRYTVPLRDILIEYQQVNRRLISLQNSDREPAQEKVRDCGQELARIGGTFKALCGDSAMAAQTRIGFVEDLDLFQQIADVQEEAADRFMSMADLPEEARGEMRPARPVGMLEQVGRDLIEKEVTDWVTRKGFGDLLADGGQHQLGGKVNKRLQLDLNGYLNKKSVEVAGMPLRGFRSMKAAFRLQARRKIRELVAELVVDFTGNRLVIMLLQNIVLDWAENQLWPQLREAFRPKGNLPHRVDVSVGTMQQARRSLFELSKNLDPGLVPLNDVLRELNRAAGTVHATRYLERDLEASDQSALRSRFLAERNNLTQAMRVVMGQFLLYEEFMGEEGEGRISRLNDLTEHIEGIQEDVLYVLNRMGSGLHEMNILYPSDSEKLDALGGSLPFKWEHHQQYLVRLNELKEEDLEGVKRLAVWVNERQFVLYGIPDVQHRQLEFKGFLPTPPGRYAVRMECRDIPGVPQEEWLIQVAANPGSERLQRCAMRAQQRINSNRSRLNQMTADKRQEELQYQASLCMQAAGCSFGMGNLNAARNWASSGVQLAMQSGNPHSGDHLFQLYRTMAMVELFAGNLNGYVENRQQEIEARVNRIRFRESPGGSRDWNRSNRSHAFLETARAAFETADLLLVTGVSKDGVNSWMETGRKYGRMSGLDMQMKMFHPNVAAVFGIQ